MINTSDKKKENTKSSWRKIILKRQTEGLICAAKREALRRNYLKLNLDKTAESLLWRICQGKDKKKLHIASKFKTLVKKENKRRHDNIRIYIYWRLY